MSCSSSSMLQSLSGILIQKGDGRRYEFPATLSSDQAFSMSGGPASIFDCSADKKPLVKGSK